VDPELLGEEPVRLPRQGRTPDAEILDANPRDPWRPNRWVLTAVVLAVAVSTLAWYVDRQARARESEALTTCQKALHNAVISSDLQLMSIAANIAPVLASTKGRQHAAAAHVMSHPARQVLPEVLGADRLCRQVSVRPWHFALKTRRDAATAYSSALAARLRAVAADGRAFFQSDSALRRLRKAADIGVFGGRY
jgi:hypothetical protein